MRGTLDCTPGIATNMDSDTPIENHAHLDPATFAELARAVASHRSIKHALDWLIAQSPPLSFSDMVTQDEFSHDILAELPGGLHLVYDIT
jgi:hypothetical protein